MRPIHPPSVFLALLLAWPSAAPAAEGAKGAAVQPEALSPDDARAEFEAMCRRTTEGDEMYHGRKPLADAQRRLAAAPPRGEEAVRARVALGQELLKQGSSQEGVDLLTEATALLDDPGVDEELRIHVGSWLALAHLRAGEDSNCVMHHTQASCIVPIEKGGVHMQPVHARKAGDILLGMVSKMDVTPRSIHFVWLANLARMVSGDYPDGMPVALRLPGGAFESDLPFPRWRDRAMTLGIDAVDLAGGAVMDDFDGDGLLDLVSSTSDPCGSLKAFRSDGKGGFEDVTRAWGLDTQLGGLNLMHADYDGDGRLDLLVLRGGWLIEWGKMRNSLLRNELGSGRGRFVDVSLSSGVGRRAQPGQTAGWADYDGDGDLDLYVGNESRADESHPNELLRNNGDGTFTDVAEQAGVLNDRYCKALAWGDYDDDGDPDLYVSNIGPNRLYRNDGDGTFTDVAAEAGVIEPQGRSFTTWFFDFDNDGDLDLFVADYGADVAQVSMSYFGIEVPNGQPLLYRNDGGRFTEVSRGMGIDRPSLPMGANYGDLDNDGWLDFYLGTGNPLYESIMPNEMYRNLNGRGFADVTFVGGFGHLQKGHGVAFGDLDNDGDQDLFHQLGGFYPGDKFANALFENPGNDAAWITLRLEGKRANRWGIGARIEVRTREAARGEAPGRQRTIHVVAGSGGSFGGSSMQQEIGLGAAVAIEEIVVRWPGSGTVDRISGVRPGRVYRLVEGEGRLRPVEAPRLSLGGHP